METLVADLRFAVRTLRRAPAFAAAAIVSIALGIGANTLVYSWLDSLVLSPFPVVAEPQRLAAFNTDLPNGFPGISYSTFRDLRDGMTSLEGMAVHAQSRFSLRRAMDPADRPAESVWGQYVSGNFFTVLGVGASSGRVLSPADETGALPVAVISDAFWRRRMHAAADVVGASLYLNGNVVTVVGIAPPGFGGVMAGLGYDLWLPVTLQRQVASDSVTLTRRSARWLQAVGRIATGATRAQVAAEMGTLSRRVSKQAGEQPALGIRTVQVREQFLGALLFPLFGSLLGVTALLLLIACANVGGLLLSRAASRRGEIGLRLALGASRRRLVRQLLTENGIVALAGGALGVVFAAWSQQLFLWFVPLAPFPVTMTMRISPRVYLLSAGVSAFALAMSGVLPALRASRADMRQRNGAGGMGAPGPQSRLRSGLVAGQVAFTVVALVCAGLFLRSLAAARDIELGFGSPDEVLVVNTDFTLGGVADSLGLTTATELLRRVRAIPGVRRAAVASMVPLGFGGHASLASRVDGYVPAQNEQMELERVVVSDGYFATMRLAIVSGRAIDERDRTGSAPVVVVNQAFAARFFRGQDPTGHRVEQEGQWATIVGMVRNSKYSDLVEVAWPVVYAPLAQSWRPSMALHLWTTGDPAALTPAVRRAFAATRKDLPMLDPRTLREHMAAATFVQKIGAAMLGAFGVLALLLAAVGLYGVIAYGVSQRVREIGLRMALGLSPHSVTTWILSEGIRLVLIGLGVGMVLALGAARLVANQLLGVAPLDVPTFGLVAVLLLAVALLATWLPARRAAQFDPAQSLRS